MPGNYDPAAEGLPKYFASMLDDAGRNVAYDEAIGKCIAEFKRVEGYAPTVLDVGVGTGMLSAQCVRHGAAHVTSVDVNATMVQLAKESLLKVCLLYTSPSPRDLSTSRMPSSA